MVTAMFWCLGSDQREKRMRRRSSWRRLNQVHLSSFPSGDDAAEVLRTPVRGSLDHLPDTAVSYGRRDLVARDHTLAP